MLCKYLHHQSHLCRPCLVAYASISVNARQGRLQRWHCIFCVVETLRQLNIQETQTQKAGINCTYRERGSIIINIRFKSSCPV